MASLPALVGLGRSLRRLLARPLRHAAAHPGCDRYRKHFTTGAHLQMLLLHGFDGHQSLRQTHAVCAGIGWDRFGLAQPVSRSQLARSSTSRSAEPAEALLASLLARARSRATHQRQGIRIIDSTFVRLRGTGVAWSKHGKHVPGVRVHVVFDPDQELPIELELRRLDTNDIGAFAQRDLTDLVDTTLIMDRGYHSHVQFARLLEAEVSFIVRLQAQVRIAVTRDHLLPPPAPRARDTIISDQTVTIGSPNHRGSPPVAGLRLITSQTGSGDELLLITDRFDLEAAEVTALYRRRWQIELFFRWLKHQLGAVVPLGRSREAVWLTVVLLCCVFLLLALLDSERPPDYSKIAWLRTIAALFHTTRIAINSS